MNSPDCIYQANGSNDDEIASVLPERKKEERWWIQGWRRYRFKVIVEEKKNQRRKSNDQMFWMLSGVWCSLIQSFTPSTSLVQATRLPSSLASSEWLKSTLPSVVPLVYQAIVSCCSRTSQERRRIQPTEKKLQHNQQHFLSSITLGMKVAQIIQGFLFFFILLPTTKSFHSFRHVSFQEYC